ncbi:MAG: sulfotransferase domain-containing protein [Caldilineaceae bacterium]|nr:sulfotransferase domain-containing protein [Caldilineaceae bacterium]
MTVGQTYWKTDRYITNWEEFDAAVRTPGHPLLHRLDDFPHAVLVTGCQRSGTTMLTRLITESEPMVNYWFGPDDELDGALILSGYVDHIPAGRYCFQTTYVNNHQHEYYQHNAGHKVIFLLRNPLSVVYSMLYNWRPRALDRIFGFCGIGQLHGLDRQRYRLFGIRGISKLRRACYGYTGKVAQVFELRRRLTAEQLLVIDYDELVTHKAQLLPLIYRFIDLPYQEEYAAQIHARSMSNVQKLSGREIATIQRFCKPIYQKASALRTPLTMGSY